MVVRSIRSMSPSAFWVIGSRSVTRVKIPTWRALSSIRASMSLASECDCSAARYRRKGTRSRMDGGSTSRSDSEPSDAGRGSAICKFPQIVSRLIIRTRIIFEC